MQISNFWRRVLRLAGLAAAGAAAVWLLGLVLLPFAPMLVGVADQAMDLRRLHGPKDDEGGFEL